MMKTKALCLVCIMLFSTTLANLSEPDDYDNPQPRNLEDLLAGFYVSSQNEIWNETPFQDVAVPGGFDLLTVIDYSDVGVLINNNSEESKTIGWAFVNARNIRSENIFFFNHSDTPTGETINRNQFNTYFAYPFLEMLSNHTDARSLNYLVTTKGIPLRVSGGNNKASFDQELSLLGGSYNSSIGEDYWIQHSYGPLAGNNMESFTRDEYGFFLVTRLTGYTIDTALGLIDKANNSIGSRGNFVLDLATNRNNSGYKFWNDDLYTANTSLSAMNQSVIFDEETEFLTNISNVIGYASWGSNDGNWGANWAKNTGFETADSAWSSGIRHWNATLPTLSSTDSFEWMRSTSTKNAGSASVEASISATCSDEGSNGTQGIFAEFFDNEGVSFNTGSMPSLIDRVPDHVRLESSLQYNSMYPAYPGLDDRFKNNWGARFSGLIDIPETGNWTFYLTTDDGSEMWVDGSSIIKNYGSHGMREISGFRNLSEGHHEFKIEFFQGGGPHGLNLKWEGPNQTKALVPSSAFVVSDGLPPSPNTLIHAWNFDEGFGSESNDSVVNGSSVTLYNMNSSNWRSCADGNCLWFDGVDDYVQVDVNDWVGNFSVSQWVWANSTTIPDYASVFAVSNNAGSNSSFQHAIFNGEWRLHNNQTHKFGDVIAQQWMHLVTVFDNGTARQYIDGVLVRETNFPTGSVNNIDLYKFGVNRAGSTYFEGMIDKVMIWESALSNDDITTLSRDIYKDCSAYSGSGQSAAYIEQYLEIDPQLNGHAWIASVQDKRNGDVFGDYLIRVESMDENGTILTSNSSSSKNFENNWGTNSFRFRPDENATSLRIQIPISLVATSTSGSIFFDSFSLRAIRPHNGWVDGAIAETAVSTGGRSFTWGTTYGQSLIADLLEDGVSGVKGYVYEPYLTSVGYPSVLLPSYASGYNFAEANYAANLHASWMGVYVGDPKMTPFIDSLHDIDLIDARAYGNYTEGYGGEIELALQNLGMNSANGNIEIKDMQGSQLLTNISINISEGDKSGSRQKLLIPFTPTKSGWMNLQIRYVNYDLNSSEKVLDNNLLQLSLWINEAPIINTLTCDSGQYNRGDTFRCSAYAADDIRVVSGTMWWRIITENSTTDWIEKTLGSNDGVEWWTTITIPANATDIPLGNLSIKAVVRDDSNISSVVSQNDRIAEINDAPGTWFGIHISDIDDQEWSGATPLPLTSLNRLTRGIDYALEACVLEADHVIGMQIPSFVISRGNLSETSYSYSRSSNHHCYSAIWSMPISSNLDSVNFQLRDDQGSLISSRNINVEDIAPMISITMVNDENIETDRAKGDGTDFVRISIFDQDDIDYQITGDISVTWPGQSEMSLPIEFENGILSTIINLEMPTQAIESGNLIITVEITGANTATASESILIPVLFTPPSVDLLRICTESGENNEVMFGHNSVLIAQVSSDRPILRETVIIQQLGWQVNAPRLDSAPDWLGYDDCHQAGEDYIYFRLRPDGSFINGNGTLKLSVTTIDMLVDYKVIEVILRHAPPVPEFNEVPENITAGSELVFDVMVSDLDGINDVTCNSTISKENGSIIWQGELNPYPISLDSGIATFRYITAQQQTENMTLATRCYDSTGEENTVLYPESIRVEQFVPESRLSNESELQTADDDSFNMSLIILGAIAFAILVATAIFATKRGNRIDDEVEPQKETIDFEKYAEFNLDKPQTDIPENLKLPDGWTMEQYENWLNSGIPDGWNAEQWDEFRNEQISIIEEITPE